MFDKIKKFLKLGVYGFNLEPIYEKKPYFMKRHYASKKNNLAFLVNCTKFNDNTFNYSLEINAPIEIYSKFMKHTKLKSYVYKFDGKKYDLGTQVESAGRVYSELCSFMSTLKEYNIYPDWCT